jgi:hypothetical protein
MLRALFALIPAFALGACADGGDEGMDILNNTTVQTGTTCTLTGLTGQAFTSQGVISAASPTGYLATPLIESRITALMGQESQKTIQLQGATVHLSLPPGNTAAITLDPGEAAFMAPFSGDLPPSGTVNVGFTLVPESVIAKVRALGTTSSVSVVVQANVQIFGQLAGSRINGTSWSYPVTVCNDCVVSVTGPCPATGTIRTGNPCNIFQDGAVDCCTSASGGLVCPAATM